MPDERHPLVRLPFTDGSVRPVFEDADGRQFVLDGETLVYRAWVRPVAADEPLVVSG